MRFIFTVLGSCLVALASAHGSDTETGPPMRVGVFEQQVHLPYTEADGLPSRDVRAIALDTDGAVCVETAAGPARFADGRWQTPDATANAGFACLPEKLPWPPGLEAVAGSREAVRDMAQHGGEIAVAAENGLFTGDGEAWNMALPRQGPVRWAPMDVRAVAYDPEGRLWFA